MIYLEKYLAHRLIPVILLTFQNYMLVVSQATLQGHWTPLGEGLNNVVNDIYVDGNDVYAVGSFTDAGGNTDADFIARWDGSKWNPVGTRLGNYVRTIVVHEGDVYIGGSFINAGGNQDADGIARWDGNAWQAIGSGVNNEVAAIAFYDGEIYIGGFFTNAGGQPNADYLARFDGNQWQAVGSGIDSSVFNYVVTLESHGSYLYAGGRFSKAGQIPHTNNIARWDGVDWSPLAQGYAGDMGVTTIASDEDNIYVGGDGGPFGSFFCGVSRWEGTSWNGLGSGLSDCIYGDGAYAIDAYDGGSIVGGNFTHAGGINGTACLAKWDGSEWLSFGETGLNEGLNNILALAHDEHDLYVGGVFSNIAGVEETSYIARWEAETVSSEFQGGDSAQGDLVIFPNPVRHVLHFKSLQNNCLLEFVRITGITSQMTYEKSFPEQHMDVSFLPPGVYVVEANTSHQTHTRMLIKIP